MREQLHRARSIRARYHRVVVIEGRTVRLRPVTMDDADAWLAGEDEQMARMFEFPRRSTRDDVVRAITGWSEMWRTGGAVRNWGICIAATGELVGGVELRPRDAGEAGELNVSYWVAPSWRQRGIAKEAVALAIEYAATELRAPSVVIKALRENVASLGVARAVGATFVGEEPSDAAGIFRVFRRVL
jgi:RimJ/RimL family protein N-acetyltransferase